MMQDINWPASGNPPLSGEFTATGNSATFTPLAGRPFNISLWGTFGATVRVTRSFQGGPFLPITANGGALLTFSGPVSEQWSEPEANVAYRFECPAFSTGTVSYRMSQ